MPAAITADRSATGHGDNLKSIRKLKAEIPRLRILVYSALKENIFAERAMRAGASGYVMTQAPTDAQRPLFARL